MSQIKDFKNSKRTTRSRAPAGKLLFEEKEEKFLLTFRYSKQRAEEIKTFSEARFDQKKKSWHFPIKHWREIRLSEHFSSQKILYDLDLEKVDKAFSLYEDQKLRAREEVHKKPLFAKLETATRAELNALLQLSKNGNCICLKTICEKSKQAALEIPGVYYSENEDYFRIPTQAIKLLLKKLSALGLLFAVEESLGNRLSQTAEKRAEILRQTERITSKELEDSLLFPYITKEESLIGPTYKLHRYDAYQLKLALGSTGSYHQRKQLAENLNVESLCRLIYNLKKSYIYPWLESEAKNDLNFYLEQLIPKNCSVKVHDEILLLNTLELVLSTDENESAGLAIRTPLSLKKNALIEDLKPWTEEKKIHYIDEYAFLSFKEDSLKEVTEKLKATDGIYTSLSYEQAQKQIFQREELLRRHRYYSKMTDCRVDSLEKELHDKLFPHQRVAVKWLRESEASFLGDDMGLGKTLSVLAHYKDLKEGKELDFILVICPNSLVTNWEKEVADWTPELKIVALPKTKAKREKFLLEMESGVETDCDGIVVNFEGARIESVANSLKKIISKKNALFVVDESQRAKNANSSTFSALKTISENATRRVLLSGTPAPKDISDIWAQIYLLDRGERFGDNFYEWLPQIAELGNDYSEYAIKEFKQKEVKKVIARARELLLRRRKENVVELPEKIFSTRYLPLTGNQLSRYNEIVRELKLRLTTKSGKEFSREIDNILEEFLRAVQTASNPRLIDESWEGEPTKFLELDNIVKEIVEENGSSVVIWTNYLKNVRELTTRYSKLSTASYSGEVSREQRKQIIEDFQAKKIKILIAVPAAGGVGITLTAAQTAVYIDKTWNAEHWMQSIDRVHRIGQNGTVNIISLESTRVDYLIARNLGKKQAFNSRLLDKDEAESVPIYPSKEELLEAL